MRPVSLLEAPSNLGLRPPEEGSVPGCYKLPGALRDTCLLDDVLTDHLGVVTPPRYRAARQPGKVRNCAAIADYTIHLAQRIGRALDERPEDLLLVLGGDCSILLGPILALRRRGRPGLVFCDGHSDFTHPGNADSDGVGAAAGEDLALVTGRGHEALTDIDGLRPYVDPRDVVLLCVREGDEYLAEIRAAGATAVTSTDLVTDLSAAATSLERLARTVDRVWVHVDADVLDESVMPAVDSPEPGGLAFDHLTEVLRPLLRWLSSPV
jgi:arginase